MDIHEFFRAEGFIGEFKCFDGRWQFEFNYDEQIYGKDLFEPQLQWTDMFGKGDKVIFKFDQPHSASAILNVIPLTTHFVIMQCRDTQEEVESDETEDDDEGGEDPTSWYIIKLDWLNQKCTIESKTFTCKFLNHINHDSYLWIDQADLYSLECDLHFIVYKKVDEHFNCKYCKIEAKTLEYQQIGPIFQIPVDSFNCVNLNNQIITGLSTSMDDCASSTAAWTSTHFYLWSEEKEEDKNEEEKYFSYIYEIEIKTGVVKKLSHKFEGRIRQMFFSFDGHLLVHIRKFLCEKDYKAPAWSKMLYGKKPFFEFKMFCLKIEVFLNYRRPSCNVEECIRLFFSHSIFHFPTLQVGRRQLRKTSSIPDTYFEKARYFRKHEPPILDEKTFSHSWQADARYIQNKVEPIEAQFE